MIDTVTTRFGLARMPFGRDLPPSRLHRHHDCGEAAARITWAVSERAIGMITGEVGTGKTVAIRSAVADLDPAAHTIIYIGNPSTGTRGIHDRVVTALGGKPVHGTAALATQAWNVLAGEAAERGRTPVLVIDEAHLLDHGQLESIRLMTNHDMDSSTPFATILVGQPTLRHAIKLGVLAALEQRITVRYQMKGMTPDETASYIRHHLAEAGRTTELFTDDAISQVHQAARGKPRTVNNICTAALIATAGAGKNLVDHASARAAIAEVTATD
jgi:type II secretory pathway predicted ATPase ExeA